MLALSLVILVHLSYLLQMVHSRGPNIFVTTLLLCPLLLNSILLLLLLYCFILFLFSETGSQALCNWNSRPLSMGMSFRSTNLSAFCLWFSTNCLGWSFLHKVKQAMRTAILVWSPQWRDSPGFQHCVRHSM